MLDRILRTGIFVDLVSRLVRWLRHQRTNQRTRDGA